MLNAIIRCECLDALDDCCAVVCDDFVECAPSTEHIFEDPSSDCRAVFCFELAPFWVRGERAATLNDVLVSFRRREMHGIDVDLAKDRGRRGDDWGNDYLAKLSLLAQIARANVPGDVLRDLGPPVAFEK